MPILTDEERIGTLIGKYRLDALLGEGGMGVVYRAQNQATGRAVAVKLLRDQLVPDTTARKRFQREARAAASLRHPNVVDVLDLGTSDDGAAFLVLELMEGESLGELLARHGRLNVEQSLAIMLPIMDALQAAHAQGFAHRDLKPDNIFLDRGRDGNVTPKLLDFGLAKPMLAEKATQLTATGSVFGTPGYMSPEQAQGIQGQDDVFDRWALGIILFECLTGEMPFDALTAAMLMNKILSERAPRIRDVNPGVPPAVAKVVDRALEQKLGKRFPSVEAFIAATRSAIEKSNIELPIIGTSAVFGLPEPGTPSAAAAAETVTDLQPARSKSRPRWLVPVLLLVGVAAGVGGFLIVRGPAPGPTPDAVAAGAAPNEPEIEPQIEPEIEPQIEPEVIADTTDVAEHSAEGSVDGEAAGAATEEDRAADIAEDPPTMEAETMAAIRPPRMVPRHAPMRSEESMQTMTTMGGPPIKGWM